MNTQPESDQFNPAQQQVADNAGGAGTASTQVFDATGIVKLQTPLAVPAFTMLGSDDAAACVDGVCVVPD